MSPRGPVRLFLPAEFVACSCFGSGRPWKTAPTKSLAGANRNRERRFAPGLAGTELTCGALEQRHGGARGLKSVPLKKVGRGVGQGYFALGAGGVGFDSHLVRKIQWLSGPSA